MSSIPGGDATDDLVEGNYIGTDVTGTVGLGNGHSGVYISAQSNTIGGTARGAGNLISANGTATRRRILRRHHDLRRHIRRDGNIVQGNLIGTDVTGTANLGNFADGVDITEVPTAIRSADRPRTHRTSSPINGIDGVHVDENGTMDLDQPELDLRQHQPGH